MTVVHAGGVPIVGQQARLVPDGDLFAARSFQGELQRVGDVSGLHRGAQLPRHDIPGEVVQDGRQIHPAPAQHLDVGEVGLPHLIDDCGFVSYLQGGTHQRP